MALGTAYGRSNGDPGGLSAAYDGGGLLTPNGIGLTAAYGGGREVEPTGQIFTMHQDFVGSTSLAQAQRRGPVLVYTRADAVATRFNSSGVLETMGTNAPRFDHDINGVPLGILIEPAVSNRLLWNRDFTNAVHVKVNVTAAKDATGLDAVASSASTLTATSANGTSLQTITIAAEERTFSVYVKRKTGTGDVDITADGGATWTTLTGLSVIGWTRHAVTSDVLNPEVGLRIVTSGDEVEIDFGQFEDGPARTSPIATTTALVARQEEVLKTTDVDFVNHDGPSTLLVRASPSSTLSISERLIALHDDSVDNRILILATITEGAQFFTQSSVGPDFYNSATGPKWTPGVEKKLALALATDDGMAYMDGVARSPDSSVDLPTGILTMNIGSDVADALQFIGHVKEFKYWKARRTDAFLAAMTT